MKLLQKFCSDEVMTLLARMDTFPEEFIAGNDWNDFLPITGCHFPHFNLAERVLIQKKWDDIKDDYFPRKARKEIIKTLMRDKSSGVATSATVISSNGPITITSVTNSALKILEDEFSKQYQSQQLKQMKALQEAAREAQYKTFEAKYKEWKESTKC